MTINKHEVLDMQRFAEERGVEFKFDCDDEPADRLLAEPAGGAAAPEECVAFDLQDPRRMDEWKLFAQNSCGPPIRRSASDELYHCGGGVNSFCDRSRRADEHLRVVAAWTGSTCGAAACATGGTRSSAACGGKKITRLTKCTACELKSMCGMCPANGELENEDAEAPVDFLCQVAHLRAHAFDLPVAPHGVRVLRRRLGLRR